MNELKKLKVLLLVVTGTEESKSTSTFPKFFAISEKGKMFYYNSSKTDGSMVAKSQELVTIAMVKEGREFQSLWASVGFARTNSDIDVLSEVEIIQDLEKNLNCGIKIVRGCVLTSNECIDIVRMFLELIEIQWKKNLRNKQEH